MNTDKIRKDDDHVEDMAHFSLAYWQEIAFLFA